MSLSGSSTGSSASTTTTTTTTTTTSSSSSGGGSRSRPTTGGGGGGMAVAATTLSNFANSTGAGGGSGASDSVRPSSSSSSSSLANLPPDLEDPAAAAFARDLPPSRLFASDLADASFPATVTAANGHHSATSLDRYPSEDTRVTDPEKDDESEAFGRPGSAAGRPATGLADDDGLSAPFARNPTFGLVPLSATEAYRDRLKGWVEIVKRLVAHFEVLLDQEKRLADSYAKAIKDLGTPVLLKGVPVFDEDETMQVLFHNIFDCHSERAAQHHQAAATIETQTLPNLRSLLIEVKKKAAGTEKEWVTLDKELAKDRETFVKLTNQFQATLDRQKWISQASLDIDGSMGSEEDLFRDVAQKDPWLANMFFLTKRAAVVKRFARNLLAKQNATRQAVLSQQASIQVFEQVVIQHLRDILSGWFSIKSRALQSQKEAFSQLNGSLDGVDPKLDWSLFRERRRDVVINPDDPAAVADLKEGDISYEGRDDPRTLIVKEGVLWRSIPGVLRNRGHTPGIYVLTASGHLHGFHPPNGLPGLNQDGVDGSSQGSQPPNQSISASSSDLPSAVDLVMVADPDLSIQLFEASIAPLRSDPRDPPDEFSVTEKPSGSFLLASARRHRLRAATADQSEFWCDLITSLAKPPVPRRTSAASVDGVAVAAASASAKRRSVPSGVGGIGGGGSVGVIGAARRPVSVVGGPGTATGAAAARPKRASTRSTNGSPPPPPSGARSGGPRPPPVRRSSAAASADPLARHAGSNEAPSQPLGGGGVDFVDDSVGRFGARRPPADLVAKREMILGGGSDGHDADSAGSASPFVPGRFDRGRSGGWGQVHDDGLTQNAWDDGAQAAWGS
ncbi:hypothetical protein DFJ73DRAFT_962277 [Zopfochytrium polystomum]|nr:hypothetical protein DFJ73DRAFT_962277 [Zopfochytrium polystomum]